MTVSVRMDPGLVRQLERAAQRRGVTKSQFIIEAVEKALGLRDPGKLLLQVRREFAPLRQAEAQAGGPADPEDPQSERVRELLRAQHAATLAEWQAPAAHRVAEPGADFVAKPTPRRPAAKARGR
jgi:predicted transcriptional regulator